MYRLKYDNYDPIANPNSIVQGDKYRITLLTSKLVRIEYSEINKFEDAQTKMVLNRKFPTPEFQVYDSGKTLKIVTKDLILKYDKKEFSPYGLSIELNGEVNHPYRGIWHYGDETKNLGGTARTLDFTNGNAELESGLMSKYGISMIDDSNSSILLKDGWFAERKSNEKDLYIFAYKRNYLESLDDYYKLTGPQPKLPRYALGNWWSRYYPYSEESYLSLMDRFEEEEIPFSVAVVDMDWHLVDIPEKYGSMWTGYTWNKDLFPDPKRFISELKERNLATTLNVHPAAGVRPFEEMYEEMGKDLHIDIENEEYIDFNPLSEDFLEAYFKYLHYPNEEMGIDFWWIDWQQGPQMLDKRIDPLWILNHYHYGDNQKENNLGITFSRYSGPGSHRYPIGFSGDTVISWESLNFQPYFTSTASNIGYGWWSHDIGGHRHGIRDDELMLRWVQYGVFSPVNRLHSADSPFLMKEPWNYRPPFANLMKEYLLLRHKLLPYLYTMNILANEQNLPLIQPMYYNHPYEESSYEVPNQYYFGTDLIVCPMTQKVDAESLHAEFKAWLPRGRWYDLQSGLKYEGNRKLKLYRKIDNMGLFFKEGSILPLSRLDKFTNDISNPKKLELIIGYGASGEFILQEDFIGKELIEDKAQTKITYNQDEKEVIIHPVKGNFDAVPSERAWQVTLFGVDVKKASVTVQGKAKIIKGQFNADLNKTIFDIPKNTVKEKIILKLIKCESIDEKSFKTNKILRVLQDAQTDNQDKDALYNICISGESDKQILSELYSFNANSPLINKLIEIILA